MLKTKILVVAVFLAGCLYTLYWYGWSSVALSQSEVNAYLSRISALKQTHGGQHDLSKLRSFLESDDGKAFYTVNLYRFHLQAQYVNGHPEDRLTGEQAYLRFSQVMIKLLAKQGSHPVFGSHWVAENNNSWDQVVMVRYHSRRDMAEIFSQAAFAEASKHKWASIQSNERLVVQALSLPELFAPLLMVGGLLTGCFLILIVRLSRTN